MSIFQSQNAAFVRLTQGTSMQNGPQVGLRGGHYKHLSVSLDRSARDLSATSSRRQNAQGEAAKCATKRGFDLVVSLCALLALAPLLIVLALLVKITSRGPILFKQVRTGLNGTRFVILKFRTMKVQERGGNIVQAMRNDQRLTPIGHFLRKSSLDELPQFLNVLFGDMSIVGPRPHALAHDRHYGAVIPTYCERFRVRPGITGFAQCNGARGPTETVDKMRRRVRLDLAYVERWSWEMEMKIIAKTVKVLVGGDNMAF